MKKNYLFAITNLISLATILSGCDAIAGIFKAGVWTGIILIIIVIVIIGYIVSRKSS